MIILGIDTSTDILNLAVIQNGKMVVDYKIQQESKTHSLLVIPTLKDILDTIDFNLKKLEGIAVAIGPGSFTGLRIGLATSLGLAFSLKIPIVGVNTLDVYATKYKEFPGILCPLMRAKKDEYYFALFRKENTYDKLVRINHYQCKSWVNIQKDLIELDLPIYIFGYGLADIVGVVKDNHNLNYIHFIEIVQDSPGAAIVALIGEIKILNNEFDNLFKLTPFYVHRSAAEIKKNKFK